MEKTVIKFGGFEIQKKKDKMKKKFTNTKDLFQ